MRCLALAEVLAVRGSQPLFLCRDHEGHLIANIRARTWPVEVLPAPDPSLDPGSDPYAAWRGVPVLVDAEQTLEALNGCKPEWLVVDHYGLDVGWEARVRPHVGRLLSIDDLERPHESDVLLDQNYAPARSDRYGSCVPAGGRTLLGPRYALLDAQYRAHREGQSPRPGRVNRVLIYFGGVDASNMTGQALTALSSPNLASLEVDVVIGVNHPVREAVWEQATARPRTRVFGPRPHLADVMATADLAIGAGGVTTWERMCLGLPSLVISHVDNQRRACEALAADGLIDYLGDYNSVSSQQIGDAVSSLRGDTTRLLDLSSRGQRLVDGRGAPRVVDVMVGRDGSALLRTRQTLHAADARPAGFGPFVFAWIDRCDPARVLALRNQPHVTSQMRTRTVIPAEDHARFLERYAQLDRYDFVLIDTTNGCYVGAFYITGVCTVPELGKYIGEVSYLGAGIGRRATRHLLEFCRRTGIQELTSVTRADNGRNIALNTSLGFSSTGSALGEYLVMTLEI